LEEALRNEQEIYAALVRLPCEFLKAGDRPLNIAENLRRLTTPYVQHVDSIRNARDEQFSAIRAGTTTGVPLCGPEFAHQISL